MSVTSSRKVRVRLTAIGVPQHALAKGLGVSQATLSLWLNGYRRLPEGFEERAAAALDLLEQAERAATEARAKVLTGEGADRVREWRRTTYGSTTARR